MDEPSTNKDRKGSKIMEEATKYIEIVQFDENWTKKMSQFIFEPHSHEEDELLIITDGEIEHLIDFSTSIIKAPFISFVNKGKIHQIKFRKDIEGKYPSGWLVRFSDELVIDSKFITYANYYEYSSVELSRNEQLSSIIDVIQLIDREIKDEDKSLKIVDHLLETLFEMIERARLASIKTKEMSSLPYNITFKNFLRIVENNFSRDESVDFYANKLNMSARSLNQICQQILQKSISEIVEIRKLVEAKKLLLKTDMTISEIGYELGYNDKAYFSNVFKKKNGVTPSDFRNKMRHLYAH